MRLVLAAALMVALGSPARGLATAPQALQPLAFLLGDWKAGANEGAHGQGEGGCTFHTDLQDKVIVRTNHAEYGASGDRPAVNHDDLMVIYATEDGSVRADYYDNEGHVIRYAVSSSQAGTVTLVSDTPSNGPRYRIEYKLEQGGTVSGQFAIAPPGSPDAFKTYLTWDMEREVKKP
jgi:hypothetical protein